MNLIFIDCTVKPDIEDWPPNLKVEDLEGRTARFDLKGQDGTLTDFRNFGGRAVRNPLSLVALCPVAPRLISGVFSSINQRHLGGRCDLVLERFRLPRCSGALTRRLGTSDFSPPAYNRFRFVAMLHPSSLPHSRTSTLNRSPEAHVWRKGGSEMNGSGGGSSWTP